MKVTNAMVHLPTDGEPIGTVHEGFVKLYHVCCELADALGKFIEDIRQIQEQLQTKGDVQ